MGSCCDYELDEDSCCCGQFSVQDMLENSHNSMETRHQSNFGWDEANKKSFQRQRETNEKIPGKKSSSKFSSLKLVLVIIVLGTFLTFLFSPIVHTNHVSQSSMRLKEEVHQTEHKSVSDSRYISHINVNWTQISKLMEIVLNGKKGKLNTGLLNFNTTDGKKCFDF